ncbi:MAG TPA: hypothetical protein VKJ00_05490, partial [Thermoanaerobaculia bacterium]|nr:hypothetical protein [Thermoanaerobaculia bacterium]
VASRILERHFPESLHPDILNAVGLSLEESVTRRKRDPAFRQRVPRAYDYRCAVCGFDVRLGSVSIALDAAHIRWHQAGGPETESNGLASCVLRKRTVTDRPHPTDRRRPGGAGTGGGMSPAGGSAATAGAPVGSGGTVAVEQDGG